MSGKEWLAIPRARSDWSSAGEDWCCRRRAVALRRGMQLQGETVWRSGESARRAWEYLMCLTQGDIRRVCGKINRF